MQIKVCPKWYYSFNTTLSVKMSITEFNIEVIFHISATPTLHAYLVTPNF